MFNLPRILTLAAVLATAILLLLTEHATSENTPATTASLQEEHPLAKAQNALRQAQQNFTDGETEKARENLQTAKKWLQEILTGYDGEKTRDEKTRSEADQLILEIGALEKEINASGEVSENAISRLLHRSVNMVEREFSRLATDWSEASTAGRTLKFLLDARLHFSYAEHELFIGRETEAANSELDTTISFLDDASDVATPAVQKRIAILKQEIRQLKQLNNKPYEVNETNQHVVTLIDQAAEAIKKAGNEYTDDDPKTVARIGIVQRDIENLRNSIKRGEKRQRYEAILEDLRKLTNELSP